MTASRGFPRGIEALESVFEFTAEVLPDSAVSPALRRSVDFVLEEYFTNIVKYGGGTGAIGIDIDLSPSGVKVALTEPDANRFDVTRVPPVDTTLPIEQRQPGGLGLHLARRLVDTLEYDYAPDERRSRITFTIGTPPATAARTEQVRDAGH
jgi:anti-sigma regulatory factor (Ser/Thr protein kinase)